MHILTQQRAAQTGCHSDDIQHTRWMQALGRLWKAWKVTGSSPGTGQLCHAPAPKLDGLLKQKHGDIHGGRDATGSSQAQRRLCGNEVCSPLEFSLNACTHMHTHASIHQLMCIQTWPSTRAHTNHRTLECTQGRSPSQAEGQRALREATQWPVGFRGQYWDLRNYWWGGGIPSK